MSKQLNEIFGDVIHTYTRDQAIADGALVDVTTMAAEAGIKIPVALTARVMAELVKPSVNDAARWFQTEAGRLWDLVWMLSCAIRSGRANGKTEVLFKVLFVIGGRRRLKVLKAVISPVSFEEGAATAITVSFPEEN